MSIDRSSPGAGRARTWRIALVAAAGIIAAVVCVAIRPRPTPTPVAALRLALATPDELTVGAGTDFPFGLSLAPDGRRLVFAAAKAGAVQLHLLDLTTGDTQPLRGTDEGVLPFWSPDGRAVGFFAAGKLRVFRFEDGVVSGLADVAAAEGAAWHPNGDILFVQTSGNSLVRRQPDGTIVAFTTLAPGESGHAHPSLLGNGRDLVFFVQSSEPTQQGIWLARYDNPSDRTRLVRSDAHGVALDDAVLYSSDGALVAQPIDVERRAGRGRPVLLGASVGRSPHHRLFATVGGDVVVFGAPATSLRELRWVDRSGTTVGTVGEPMDAWDVRVAPLDARVAVARVDPQLKTLDIWTYDGTRPLPRRISPAIDADEAPAWSRDATAIAWVSGRRAVTVRGARAELPEQMLRKFDHPVRVSDWSDDSKWIVVSEARPDTRGDIWLVPATGVGEPTPYAHSPFNEVHGVVSPDGRWLAYASDESGGFEIYIDAFPSPATRARLTVGGGTEPHWSGDGTELFFRRGAEIYAVRPDFAGASPEATVIERLFTTSTDLRSYDVNADGIRFLINIPAEATAPRPMTVLVNVRSLLPSAP